MEQGPGSPALRLGRAGRVAPAHFLTETSNYFSEQVKPFVLLVEFICVFSLMRNFLIEIVDVICGGQKNEKDFFLTFYDLFCLARNDCGNFGAVSD